MCIFYYKSTIVCIVLIVFSNLVTCGIMTSNKNLLGTELADELLICSNLIYEHSYTFTVIAV